MLWNDSSIGWGRQDPPPLDPWVPADRTCSPCLRSTRDGGALQKTPFDISIAHTFNPNEGWVGKTLAHSRWIMDVPMLHTEIDKSSEPRCLLIGVKSVSGTAESPRNKIV